MYGIYYQMSLDLFQQHHQTSKVRGGCSYQLPIIIKHFIES